MSGYTPPNMQGLSFKFTTGGYVVPPFDAVSFRWGLRQQIANLQAAINVIGLYQTSTYTYIKECPTIIVGYTQHSVQVLKLPCVYGGIRDIGAAIFGELTHFDLPAYIFASFYFKDLSSYIRGNVRGIENLGAYLFSIPPFDLPAIIHGWAFKNLGAVLSGFATIDLSSIIYPIPPVDLQAILNVIEIQDLSASITGEWWHSQVDLGAYVYKIYLRESRNLLAAIFGWQEANLSGYLNPMHFSDLGAYVGPIRLADLPATISPIMPINLNALIHGWQEANLLAYIVGGYGPGDLQAYINVIVGVNLGAHIHGLKGIAVPFDLKATVQGSHVYDLLAYIGITSPVDLQAIINATGQAVDLRATIIPKMIAIKKAIQISLLEHLDLRAMINFQCFGSGYKDLSACAYSIQKLDLRAYIIGWSGGTAENVKDLGAYINASQYDVQDRLPIVYVGHLSNSYSLLKIVFDVKGSYVNFDTLNLRYSSLYAADLAAYINGTVRYVDLVASLTPVFDSNYTELPPWVIPKTHEVVINLEKFEEQWVRFVEIMFDNSTDSDYHYFYVNAEHKVYKVDRSKHWTIWVKSYVSDDTSIIDRKSVRFKYGFNMSNYRTIDEAVRDLVDRVSSFRRVDLSANIIAIPPNYADLGAAVEIKTINKWSKNLGAALTAV